MSSSVGLRCVEKATVRRLGNPFGLGFLADGAGPGGVLQVGRGKVNMVGKKLACLDLAVELEHARVGLEANAALRGHNGIRLRLTPSIELASRQEIDSLRGVAPGREKGVGDLIGHNAHKAVIEQRGSPSHQMRKHTRTDTDTHTKRGFSQPPSPESMRYEGRCTKQKVFRIDIRHKAVSEARTHLSELPPRRCTSSHPPSQKHCPQQHQK